jgi:site-specific recombinase XerD
LLGEHYDTDPVDLSEEQLRDYFVFLRVEKAYRPSSMNQAKVALRVFYRDYLRVDPPWRIFEEVVVRQREVLPVVISREEVSLILAKLTEPKFISCLSLIYSCGLRLSEALGVEVRDIDAAARRLHVRCGKGGKARFVPISEEMIRTLRRWWSMHRHPRFLFPAVGRRWRQNHRASIEQSERSKLEAMRKAAQPMSKSTVQNALKWAVAASGTTKRVTVHTLRHCYATHLLEDGISLRHISAYLGHASLNQTLVYAHLTAAGEERTHEALSKLYKEVISRKKKS